jgi:TPR repeat protein
MRRLSTFTVSLILLGGNCWAAQKSIVPPDKGESKMMAHLLKRCENGVALACFHYGVTIKKSKSKTNKRTATKYLRRACTLAYAPACETRSTVAISQPFTDRKPKVDGNGKPCNAHELTKSVKLASASQQVTEITKGSLWDQAGVEVGDKILSVNGEAYTVPKQIGEALENGGAVLNLDRDGRETSVILDCD